MGSPDDHRYWARDGPRCERGGLTGDAASALDHRGGGATRRGQKSGDQYDKTEVPHNTSKANDKRFGAFRLRPLSQPGTLASRHHVAAGMHRRIATDDSKPMPHDTFISYAHDDRTVADSACAKLEVAGIVCWMAPRDALAGVSYPGQLVDAIATSRVVVLILSSHSMASQQVRSEIERAFSKRHTNQFRSGSRTCSQKATSSI